MTKYQARFLVKNRVLQIMDENVDDMDVICDSLWTSILKVEEKDEQEAFLKLSKKRHSSKDKCIFIDNKGKKIEDTGILVTEVIDITGQKEEIKISQDASDQVKIHLQKKIDDDALIKDITNGDPDDADDVDVTITQYKDEAFDTASVLTSLLGELPILAEVVEIISQVQPDVSHPESIKDTTEIQAPEKPIDINEPKKPEAQSIEPKEPEENKSTEVNPLDSTTKTPTQSTEEQKRDNIVSTSKETLRSEEKSIVVSEKKSPLAPKKKKKKFKGPVTIDEVIIIPKCDLRTLSPEELSHYGELCSRKEAQEKLRQEQKHKEVLNDV